MASPKDAKLWTAVLITAAALALAAYLAYYTWPSAYSTPQFSASYWRNLVQRFTLSVANRSGYPTYFCASIYGWLPDNSFELLDVKCGLGSVELNKTALRRYAEAWRGVEGQVGVFVFLTYINGTRGGHYTWGRAVGSFLMDPGRILAGQSMAATLRVRGKPPNLPINFGEQLTAQSSPPDAVYYIWRLERIYVSAANSPVPVVVVRVSDPFSASLINGVGVSFEAYAYQSYELYFNGGAEVEYHGITQSCESGLYSFTLSGQKTFMAAAYYPVSRGPGVVAVGFYGDYAVVNYTEYEVGPDGRISPTGYSAVLYVVRPAGGRSLVGYSEVDAGSSFNSSWLNALMNQVATYWTPQLIVGGRSIMELFSAQEGVSALGMAMPVVGGGSSTARFLSTGLRAGLNGVAIGGVSASLLYTAPQRYFLVARFYTPPINRCRGVYYPASSMFMDIYVGEGAT